MTRLKLQLKFWHLLLTMLLTSCVPVGEGQWRAAPAGGSEWKWSAPEAAPSVQPSPLAPAVPLQLTWWDNVEVSQGMSAWEACQAIADAAGQRSGYKVAVKEVKHLSGSTFKCELEQQEKL